MEKDPSTLQPSGASGGASGSGEEKVPGLLRLFSGDAAMAEVLPLRDGALELGRGAVELGEVQDPRMSRRHARVHFDGRRFWVTDLGSQNGTFVEGKQVPARTPQEVQRVLRMGDSLFVPCADVGPLARHGVVLRDGFVRGHAMQRLLAEVARLAQVGSTLHIHGESGAGKEGVARAFHQSGPRGAGPFVAVNCAAIPQSLAERLLFGARRGAYSGADADAQGYVQAADGGTLFLDEVVELDLSVQAKLLRVLESREVLSLGASKPKPVDLHVCSASNKDLRARVAGGHLREDLYFRLGRPEVMLPPLRQRPEEIPLLLQQEVRQVAPGLGMHVSLVEECLLRPWPGNVRELRVEVRSAVQSALLGGEARVKALHLSPSAGTAFGPAMSTPVPMETGSVRREVSSRAPPLEAGEKARIEEALRQQGGNVAAAARALGMHRTQLRRLLARHGIAVAPGSEGD
ncbi:sigma 54-interacting transcriptional regulator [Pyxidicoccus sp. MSG2]|uniref:sigma 54-interacting transcriptional regulator n=1 Tax=Pyxidicoccus sp. MSG2 TaxID=2996790 RepID=UPI002272290F|nr:sigma 54-interacting transcriptional regulator [Pyxidicoccus sp. MSG2]MCY1023796.1 sigma 54-interacting transcriptional regulator [Pyxidicoccus sp. MSG2]